MVFIASVSKSSDIFVIILILHTVSATSEIDSRVVGGEPTHIKYYPYLVNIAYNYYHTCGGSYLKSRWVLTAAHCLKESRRKATTCRMAMTDLSSIQGVQSRNCARFITHPKYDNTTENNDIGLIQVTHPFDQNSLVKTVPLPTVKFTDYHTKCYVPGWGLMEEYTGGEPAEPDRVRVVKVPLIPHDKCMEMYSINLDVRRFKGLKILCAGYAQGMRDACQGDSGGPMLCGGKQVGIVSFGFGCARPVMPGIYTDVLAYIPWIQQMTYEKYKKQATSPPVPITASSTKMQCTISCYSISITLLGMLSVNYMPSLYLY